MDMIVLAIVCSILANELFAWGPRLSDLLLKIAIKRMPAKLQERMREEWQAHLDTLPGGLSKLGAAASFVLSTSFWGYRETNAKEEIEERITLEFAFALKQERQQAESALQARARQTVHTIASFLAEVELAEKQRRASENIERT